MTHVEFLGPPGVGKTTIHSKLIEHNSMYGGTREGAVGRVFLNNTERKYTIAYKLLPELLQSYLENQYFEHRLGHEALNQFISSYPNYIKIVAVAMESVSYEPEKVFSMCKRAAEIYQLGASTAKGDEVLCLDEGFSQKAFSILWREPDEKFTIKEFFQCVPEPKLLIHIDAPTEVCLRRQRERGVFSVGRGWESRKPNEAQQRLRDICFQISDYFRDETSTPVICVENVNTIESAVNKIIGHK